MCHCCWADSILYILAAEPSTSIEQRHICKRNALSVGKLGNLGWHGAVEPTLLLSSIISSMFTPASSNFKWVSLDVDLEKSSKLFQVQGSA